MAAVAAEEEVVVAENGGRDPRFRSGEHPPPSQRDIDTARLIAIREQEARAQERQTILTEQLVNEVRGLRTDLTKTSTELSDHKLQLARDAREMEARLTTLQGVSADHGNQLKAIWEQKNQQRTAWGGIWPAVIASLVSGLVSSGIVGAIAYAIAKGGP